MLEAGNIGSHAHDASTRHVSRASPFFRTLSWGAPVLTCGAHSLFINVGTTAGACLPIHAASGEQKDLHSGGTALMYIVSRHG